MQPTSPQRFSLVGMALCSFLGACAGTRALHEREIARVKHPLPVKRDQREVRALFDGEQVRLRARAFGLCKSSVSTTYELVDPETGEVKSSRMNTVVEDDGERCQDEPVSHARVSLRVQGVDYFLGETGGDGQLVLSIPALFQRGAPIPDAPGESLALAVDERDAGSMPLAPLLARRTSREELRRDLEVLTEQSAIDDADLSRGLRLADTLRGRGFDEQELTRLERALFARRAPVEQPAPAEVEQIEVAREAAKSRPTLPPAVTTTLQTGRPTQQSASWVMVLIGDFLGSGYRQLAREHREGICTSATDTAAYLIDKVAMRDPRVRVAWPLLKAMLGAGTQDYCRDVCLEALADEEASAAASLARL